MEQQGAAGFGCRAYNLEVGCFNAPQRKNVAVLLNYANHHASFSLDRLYLSQFGGGACFQAYEQHFLQ